VCQVFPELKRRARFWDFWCNMVYPQVVQYLEDASSLVLPGFNSRDMRLSSDRFHVRICHRGPFYNMELVPTCDLLSITSLIIKVAIIFTLTKTSFSPTFVHVKYWSLVEWSVSTTFHPKCIILITKHHHECNHANYSETYLDWTPLRSVQSVQSKKVFILKVTVKIGVLLGFVKEPIDCHSLGRLHLMFYKMLVHLW
jgi:hypothetical protein